MSALPPLSDQGNITSAPRFALSPAVLSKAERISAEWKGTSATGGTTKNFIGGEWLESKTSDWIDVVDPSTQTLLTRVPNTTGDEFAQAVDAAAHAFKTWQKTSVLSRQRIVLKSAVLMKSPSLQQLLRENADAIANSIVLEQGKTVADAHGDLLRGLQVVETAISITSMLMGEKLE
ncbi:hypothetical protein C0989_007119, partial [Termitomyces sp. Mn162]